MMMIDSLEAQARAGLAPDALVGARARAALSHAGHEIEVVSRVDRNGQRVFNYFCDGTRMERAVLSMLLCPETACARAQETRQRWLAFIGQAARPVPARVQPLRPRPLMEEVPVTAAGHRCLARPASFECLTPCPLGAHEPVVMRKTGWDLFEDGVWIAGGLRGNEQSGSPVPRFETPADAERWLASLQAQAERLLVRSR